MKSSFRHRFFVSMTFLGLAVLVVAGGRLLYQYTALDSVLGWLHDEIWLAVVGYGFYWGKPWSQVGVIAAVLVVIAGWLSWLLDIPFLDWPQVGITWLYLDAFQPSGHLIICWRRLRTKVFKNRCPGCGVVVRVVDELVLRNQRVLRSLDGIDRVDQDSLQILALRRRLTDRLELLSRYWIPTEDARNFLSLEEICKGTLAKFRSIRYSDDPESVSAEFLSLAEICFRRCLTGEEAAADLPGLILRSSDLNRSEQIVHTIAICSILHRSKSDGESEGFKMVGELIMEVLQSGWKHLCALESYELGTMSRLELEQWKREVNKHDVVGFYLEIVLPEWLSTLNGNGEHEAVAEVARIFESLSGLNDMNNLEQVPLEEESKKKLKSFFLMFDPLVAEEIHWQASLSWNEILKRSQNESITRYALNSSTAADFRRGELLALIGHDR